MKKYLLLSTALLITLNSTGTAALADDNKVVAGAKKVCNAIVWPFKKIGEGLKTAGKKITGN